jgi:hypothetical protein
MKNLLILIFLISILHSKTYSQKFQWAKDVLQNNEREDFSIALDALGNTYTVACHKNMSVKKLDADGQTIWTKKIKIQGQAYSIAADPSGDIYLTGWFSDTADFDPGPAVHTLIAKQSSDIFILKLTSEGHFCWVKQVGEKRHQYQSSVAIDLSGFIYVVGRFDSREILERYENVNHLSESEEAFMIKMNAAGDFHWFANLGHAYERMDTHLGFDQQGNIYFTGGFKGTADFDPGPGNFIVKATAYGLEAFVAKFDSSGHFVWIKNFPGNGVTQGQAIAVSHSGNIYATGYFNSTVDFDPGAGVEIVDALWGTHIFIVKLNPEGDFQWVKILGSESEWAYDIAVDLNENIYTVGTFHKEADFDPGPGNYFLEAINEPSYYKEEYKNSYGCMDIFISKLDASGNFVWAKSIGGIHHDWAKDIAISGPDDLYIAGYYLEEVDFDPGPDTFYKQAPKTDHFMVGDIFILKLSQQ